MYKIEERDVSDVRRTSVPGTMSDKRVTRLVKEPVDYPGVFLNK